MKPQPALKAAGLAVSHCQALFRRHASEADLLPEFGRLGERLARLLGPSLAPLSNGKAPEVRLASATRMTGGDLAGKIPPLAANCLLSQGDQPHWLLLSIDGAAVLARLDRAFGGNGEVAEDLPKSLPLSADLLAQRMERIVAERLGQLIGSADPVRVAERDCSYPALAPFRKAEPVAVLLFEISDGLAQPWPLVVATKPDALESLVAPAAADRPAAPRRPGPLDDPFAGVPLTLEAVLAEMVIPLSRLAAFTPGQTVPIPVARAVPLRVGGTIVARGTVGEFEDRVALQLTSSMFTRKDAQ